MCKKSLHEGYLLRQDVSDQVRRMAEVDKNGDMQLDFEEFYEMQ